MNDELTSTAGTSPEPTRTREERIDAALDLIREHGEAWWSKHRQWVLDQVVRTLCVDNDEYLAWVAAFDNEQREWDVGKRP